MKIVFPTVLAGSGSDVYYSRLAASLKRRGIDAAVLPLGYAYEFVPLLNKKLQKVLSGYDIIHTNGEYGHLFSVPGKPLVITLHHNVLDPVYQRYTSLPQKIYHYGLLRRRLVKSLKAAQTAICVSKATYSSYQAMLPGFENKMLTIYNGINLDVFRPVQAPAPPPARPQLLFVGNLSVRKGVDVLCAVMEKLGPRFELLCISMQKPRMAFPGNVKIATRVPLARLPELYSGSRMLFFPSRLEGFGYAVAEAMACGKPVVCANRSALPELIDDGRGGFLCDVDDVDGFAEKINCLHETPGLAQAMGAYNLAKARSMFDLDHMADAYLGLYEKILSRR